VQMVYHCNELSFGNPVGIFIPVASLKQFHKAGSEEERADH